MIRKIEYRVENTVSKLMETLGTFGTIAVMYTLGSLAIGSCIYGLYLFLIYILNLF